MLVLNVDKRVLIIKDQLFEFRQLSNTNDMIIFGGSKRRSIHS